MKGFFNIPEIKNEPILNYAPGSPERAALQSTIQRLRQQELDIPMYIGGEEVRTGNKIKCSPPHDHQHILGYASRADKSHVTQAIQCALSAKESWEKMGWESRAAIFLKAADLIAGPYRAELNAATLLCQSKTAFQSEIDSICELVDFLRFNVKYMTEVYSIQPGSSPGIWNRLEYRPLEGFVFAITPFNFTAIAGNLPATPALMGNTVVWKPADSQIYSSQLVMRIFKEAGLPDGVINLIYPSGADAGEVIFQHPDFAGLHFTGSTAVFRTLWKTIGSNIEKYNSYPRIVGETGGKDFILAHPSSIPQQVSTALTRGAFEFQGQKCSAASRAYIPAAIYDEVIESLIKDVKSFTMGVAEDFSNYITAVIDERAFDRIAKYLDNAKQDPDVEVLVGGGYDKSKGYFIEPTVLLSKKPQTTTMCEEIFGPVLTVYKYEDSAWSEILELIDDNPYALTGSVFSQDRAAIEEASYALRNSAGNFYINDKCTGAVVNQQPFGGGRGSGTNDKAGSMLNLLRWVSPRTIKETFIPATDYPYPYMD